LKKFSGVCRRIRKFALKAFRHQHANQFLETSRIVALTDNCRVSPPERRRLRVKCAIGSRGNILAETFSRKVFSPGIFIAPLLSCKVENASSTERR